MAGLAGAIAAVVVKCIAVKALTIITHWIANDFDAPMIPE